MKKVVSKIEEWHQWEQDKRTGRFENDEDFIEKSPSPDRFNLSSTSDNFDQDEMNWDANW